VWLFGGAPLLSWLVSVGVAPPNGGGVPRQASGSVAGSSLMGRGGSLTWLGWQSFQKNPLACFKKKKLRGRGLPVSAACDHPCAASTWLSSRPFRLFSQRVCYFIAKKKSKILAVHGLQVPSCPISPKQICTTRQHTYYRVLLLYLFPGVNLELGASRV
jgi:hypothetical protein